MPDAHPNSDTWLPQPSSIKEWLTTHGLRLQNAMRGEPILTSEIETSTVVGVLIEYIERLEARVAVLETQATANPFGRSYMPDKFRGPNALSEADTDGAWRIPVAVARTENTFVVVRLRAGTFTEAVERARMHVRILCAGEQIETADEGRIDSTDWTLGHYEERGLEKSMLGTIADYDVNFDITDEPTRAEQALAEQQLPLDFAQE